MTTDTDVKEQLKQQIRAGGDPPPLMARASHAQVATALRSFAVLGAANFQTLRALRVLAKNTSQKDLASTLESIASLVEQGTPLSKGMARYPWYFDPVCIAIVRASEEGSSLERGLEHVAEMMESEQEVRDKVASAIAYPAVLVVLGVLVVWVLLTFVVPTFDQQVRDANGSMEGVAAVIVSISHFVRSFVGRVVILGVIAGLVWLTARLFRQSGKSTTALFAKLPIFGTLVRTATATQFANMLGMMSASGVPLTTSLDLARSAFAETHLAAATQSMYTSVDAGRSLADAARASSVFDPMVSDMLSIGEESGRLGDMLGYVAKNLRQQLLKGAGRVELLLQPVLLMFMGGVVITIFLAFFLPYFEVLTRLSTQGR